MPCFTLTKELAYAIGTDAGNASMRKAGRSAWNNDDRDTAANETLRAMVNGGFLPLEQAIDCGFEP